MRQSRRAWAEIYDLVEERRGRHGKTSPNERGIETEKVVIAHGSKEPAKRHQFAQLTSRRIPVRARDGPRPAWHQGKHVDASRDALYGHLLALFSLFYALCVYFISSFCLRYFRHACFIPILGVGKERITLIGPYGSDYCKGSTRYWNYLGDYWTCAGRLSVVNAMGKQLRGVWRYK